MDKRQEDTLNMYQTTQDVLLTDEHVAIYTGNVPFEEAVAELGDKIEEIEELRDQQESDTTGVTQDKDNKREKLEGLTYKVGSILVFYGSTVNNRALVNKVNFTRTALKEARDNALPGMAEQVHQAAVAHAAAVLPYGLTAIITADLATAIGAFVDYISKPRAAKAETSAATEQLPGVFDKTDLLLQERLDKGMELYVDTDFYTQYFNARIIIDSPVRKRALQVNFTDSDTGQPIARLNIVVDASLKRRSTKKGNMYVQNLTEGEHSFTVSLPGYVSQTVPFVVITGETTKLAVQMVKS